MGAKIAFHEADHEAKVVVHLHLWDPTSPFWGCVVVRVGVVESRRVRVVTTLILSSRP
jgi:hypothetical protein